MSWLEASFYLTLMFTWNPRRLPCAGWPQREWLHRARPGSWRSLPRIRQSMAEIAGYYVVPDLNAGQEL